MEDLGLKAPPLRVVAAVLLDGHEVLTCRRKPEKDAHGLWELPGGRVEPGESPKSALVRAFQEQFDVSIIVEDELTSKVKVVAGGAIEFVCLRARLEGTRPARSSSHDQLLWLCAGDLSQLEWASPDECAVRFLTSSHDALLACDVHVTNAQPAATREPKRPKTNTASWATSPGVRRSMLGNRGRDTRPELAVRRILHRMGLRYRVDLRPTPEVRVRGDIVFPRQRVVVFIDGCYWHGCPQHYTAPKSNTAYWMAKLAANRERDSRTTDVLTELGWTVLRFWTHRDAADIAEEIREAVLPDPPRSY